MESFSYFFVVFVFLLRLTSIGQLLFEEIKSGRTISRLSEQFRTRTRGVAGDEMEEVATMIPVNT